MTVQDRFDPRDVRSATSRGVARPELPLRERTCEEMIRGDVKCVFDVSLRDRAITNHLAWRREVTATDTSPTARAHLEITAMQALASLLPVPDRSYDLVLSSEMPEHTPPEASAQAVDGARR